MTDTTSQVTTVTTTSSSLEIYLAWKNLRFEVPDKESKEGVKVVLNNLNGHVKPGELVAVIGPSGSGKSSFLNCISGRNVLGVTGKVLFNDLPRPSNVARFTGYVIQDDLYFESLTVRETLGFAANLKLPTTLSSKVKKERIQTILDELDLNACADTKIGTVGKGISGGERRRLAIGLEIMNEPKLLLLDEPTSGLDSASALMVGKILKTLAIKKKITILATIHQPRYSLATMFDKLYFLAKGQEIYFGLSIPHCLTFFSDNGYPCPEYDNAADFLLDLVNTSENTKPASSYQKKEGTQSLDKSTDTEEKLESESRDQIVDKLAKAYLTSSYAKEALDYTVPVHLKDDGALTNVQQDFYITPWYNQILVVMQRSFIHKVREPIAMATQAVNAIIVPLLFGSVYWQMDLTQQGALDRTSAISLIVLMNSFFAMDVLILFPTERRIFNREQSAGMYRPVAFYLGRTLSEVPQHTIFGFIMATIAYWMYGLQNDVDRYFTFVLLMVLDVSAGAGLLYMFSAMAANLEQSNMVATVFILLFMLFDGNWISLDKVPIYWRWIPHISYISYAGQAALANEYRGLEFECTTEEINNQQCLYTNGEQILYQSGIEDVDITKNIIMLVVVNICYRFLAFIAVWLLYRHLPPKLIIQKTFSFQ